MYFWISAFDHRAIVPDKMHIVQWQERELDYNGLNSFLDEKQVLDLFRHEETKIN